MKQKQKRPSKAEENAIEKEMRKAVEPFINQPESPRFSVGDSVSLYIPEGQARTYKVKSIDSNRRYSIQDDLGYEITGIQEDYLSESKQ